MQIDPQGVFISTYGCQMNVNDSERMFALLEMSNFIQVQSPEEASLIIINSCSVREKPVHKVSSELGRYRDLKVNNPNLKIGVGGCVGQQEKDRLFARIPVLDFVFGPDNIDAIPGMISEIEAKRKKSFAKFEHAKPYQIETMVRNPGVSVFVNISKGCDNFCTFCVVPFTRGRLRSRPMKDVIGDIQKLTARGVKEVTLLGQNVNSYVSDCGTGFSQLLRAVAEDTDIQRIRYTTSHPKDFDQALVDISVKYRSKICDYIHLPVQSGSSEVLRRMNRGYSREDYLEKVRMIQAGIPNVSLSTDIIVGFPGETDEQFEETMSLLDEVPYETIYAFKYSPRPFTKAEKYLEQVPEAVMSERLTRLQVKHKEIAFELARKYENQIHEVLVEDKARDTVGNVCGRTSTNKLITFEGSQDLIGQTLPVRITTGVPQGGRGELVRQ